jgi:hypothetical protein
VKKVDDQSLRYRLTAHAQMMIAERGISETWIDYVLAHPLALERDKEDLTLRHALGRIPERGDKILHVVYNETMQPWSVVTAFFDRKAGRIL